MTKKILLGSFILPIILSYLFIFHSTVNAQTCSQSSVLKEIKNDPQTGSPGIVLRYTGTSENCLFTVSVKDGSGNTVESLSLDINNLEKYISTGSGVYDVQIQTVEKTKVLGNDTLKVVEEVTTSVEVTPPTQSGAQRPENQQYTQPTTTVPKETISIVDGGNNYGTLETSPTKWEDGSFGLTYNISNPYKGSTRRNNQNYKMGYKVSLLDSRGRQLETQLISPDKIAEIEGNNFGGAFDVRDSGDYKIQVTPWEYTNNNGSWIALGAHKIGLSFTTQPIYTSANSPTQQAVGNPTTNPGGASTNPVSAPSAPTVRGANLEKLISEIYKFILPIAIIIAIIKLLISIIGITTSSGDPQRLQQAKEDITATILGLIVVLGAVTLVNIIGSAIGL